MIKKIVLVGVLMAAAVAIVAGWPDIARFLRIKQVSVGQSHPERVPAGGRTVYPRSYLDGEPDGTGDFDSASRGGPRLPLGTTPAGTTPAGTTTGGTTPR